MKGIILAGGTGSRLYPATKALSKQLLPVFDKPMIYYPLSTLMLANIREILIISTPRDLPHFRELLGDGSQWGVHLEYKEQPRPEGIAQAFQLGREFLQDSPVCLILGDNIFYGHHLGNLLAKSAELQHGALVFGQCVSDPERYGCAQFNKEGELIDIIEKPVIAPSQYAITGLYFYDNKVTRLVDEIRPSARGELEITTLNQLYLNLKELKIELLGRGIAWLDTGTHESLLDASNFIATLETRQGLRIACLEEIAYTKGWINENQIATMAHALKNSSYGNYLTGLIQTRLQ